MAHNAAYSIILSSPKCFALVRGYWAEKGISQGGYITQKRLRTTHTEDNTPLLCALETTPGLVCLNYGDTA